MDLLHWFVADSNYGQVYVGINRENSSYDVLNSDIPKAIKMAIVMHDKEIQIQEVENWLNIGLQLRPVSIIPSSLHTLNLTKRHDGVLSDDDSIVIGFHGESLVNLPAPESVILNKSEITTSSLSVNLLLAEFDIPSEQCDKLETGSILIIPESYESEWLVKLSGLGDSTLTCNGILGCDVKSLQITGRNQQLPNMAHNESDTNVKNNDSWVSLKVAIQEKINIPFDKLLCWRPDDEIYLEHSLKQYLATILLENQVIASGHLISIANGYGVYIETYKDMQDQWT